MVIRFAGLLGSIFPDSLPAESTRGVVSSEEAL